MKDIILEMKSVTKTFPGVKALDDVNVQVERGTILGICGENGAGKSTLMKVLSGSYIKGEYEGEILIDDKEVEFKSVSDAQDQGIEMIYQEMNMMLDASIAENVFVGNLPVKNGFVQYKKLYKTTEELLKLVNLDLSPKEMVRPLNSGQMQLLSLIRALAKEPRILVLDEPTTALTDKEVAVLMDLLDTLRDQGITCIYISHKLDEIFRICDSVLVIRDGQTISHRPIDSVKEEILIEEMVGRKVDNLYPKPLPNIGEEVFRVENLTVPHPNVKDKNIIENISFNLNKGEILGIGGLVGAGRSEALGAIFGQYTHNVSKDIFIDGKPVKINSPEEAIKNGIGFITEERKRNGIIWMLSISENISLASLKEFSGGLFMNKKKEDALVKEVFDELRIKAPSVRTQLSSLSGGNQQKVILAKWLLNKPKILLVDEPTKGIDVGTKADFYKIMGELTASGVSIIMVSSDMPELISMSDRCIVFSNGRISEEFAKEDIKETNIMRAAIS